MEQHILSDNDVKYFYNVSLLYYGSIDYQDILLIINGIMNPLEELRTGAVINIPDFSEILNFIKANQTWILRIHFLQK